MHISPPEHSGPLSALEASRIVGISKRAVIAAIERRALRAKKLPGPQGAYVIYKRDLDRYIAARNARAARATKTHA